jgi:hypothetical protein
MPVGEGSKRTEGDEGEAGASITARGCYRGGSER